MCGEIYVDGLFYGIGICAWFMRGCRLHKHFYSLFDAVVDRFLKVLSLLFYLAIMFFRSLIDVVVRLRESGCLVCLEILAHYLFKGDLVVDGCRSRKYVVDSEEIEMAAPTPWRTVLTVGNVLPSESLGLDMQHFVSQFTFEPLRETTVISFPGRNIELPVTETFTVSTYYDTKGCVVETPEIDTNVREVKFVYGGKTIIGFICMLERVEEVKLPMEVPKAIRDFTVFRHFNYYVNSESWSVLASVQFM